MAIRRRDGCKALCKPCERLDTIIHRGPLVVSQLDLLPITMEVDFSLLKQRRRRFLG